MASRDPEIDEIRALALRGVRPGDIAERLGLSRQRVYMRIGWLRRVGEDIPKFPRGRPPCAAKSGAHLRCRLPADVTERIASCAEAHGQSIGPFAARLLTVIARDDLVGAILDETGDRTWAALVRAEGLCRRCLPDRRGAPRRRRRGAMDGAAGGRFRIPPVAGNRDPRAATARRCPLLRTPGSDMMPDPSIIASYAYAIEDVEIAAVEFRHPEITDPGTGQAGAIRLASVFAPPSEIEAAPFFEARLEAGAALQPGEIVPFNRAPIEIVRPDKTSLGVPLARFRFSNVDARITRALIAASKTLDPVAVTVRAFTFSTRLSGQPEVLDGFELVDPVVTPAGVEVTARAPDVINTPLHRQFYDKRFPLLGL